MTIPTAGVGRWVPAIVIAVAMFSGVSGVMLGALLIPRTEIVEKPFEVLVEKRIEVPVERQVIVERKIEMPPPPFKYAPAEGGTRSVTDDELRVALLMRDDIRKADAAENMSFESKAIFSPGESLRVLVNLRGASDMGLSSVRIRKQAVDALKQGGFEVLSDDAKDGQWNTLIHVEIELIEGTNSGRVTVTVRQGMLAFSNRKWRKVNVGVAHYGVFCDFGRSPDKGVTATFEGLMSGVVRDLAAAR